MRKFLILTSVLFIGALTTSPAFAQVPDLDLDVKLGCSGLVHINIANTKNFRVEVDKLTISVSGDDPTSARVEGLEHLDPQTTANAVAEVVSKGGPLDVTVRLEVAGKIIERELHQGPSCDGVIISDPCEAFESCPTKIIPPKTILTSSTTHLPRTGVESLVPLGIMLLGASAGTLTLLRKR